MECLFGGFDVICKLLPPDYVVQVLNFCHLKMKGMHIDILAYLLGYTDLWDTWSILLTCKQWYKATRKQTFWKRRIQIEIRNRYSNIKYINKFDTFCIPIETLEDQVKWLFGRDRGYMYSENTSGDYSIVRTAGNNLMYIVFEKSGNIYQKVHQLFKKYDTFWTVSSPESKVKWSNRIFDETGEEVRERNVIYRTELGDMYEGKAHCIPETRQVIPHGDGKWIFSDGTILEGIGVAWMGEPRKPIKRYKKDVPNT